MDDKEDPAPGIPEIKIEDVDGPEEVKTEVGKDTDEPKDAKPADEPVEKDKPESESEDSPQDKSDLERLMPSGTFARRQTVTLQAMDREHSWLEEIEQKSMKLETAFISKFQFVALCNHFKKYLQRLDEDESLPGIKGEFANLFDKFRTAYASGIKLFGKYLEEKSQKEMTDSENKLLKTKLEEKEARVEELEEKLNIKTQEMEEKEREKVELQQDFNDFKLEIAQLGKRLDEEDSEERSEYVAPVAEEEEDVGKKVLQLQEDLEDVRNDLAFSKERETIYQKKLEESDEKFAHLKNEFTSTKSDLFRQITRKEKAEQLAAETAESLEKKRQQTKEMALEMQELKKDLENRKSKYNSLLKDLKQSQKKLDVAGHDLERLRRDLDNREERIKAILAKNNNLELDLASKQGDLFQLKADIMKVMKARNELARKATLQKDKILDMEKTEQILKEQIAKQEGLINSLEKENVDTVNKIKELEKNKNRLMEECQMKAHAGRGEADRPSQASRKSQGQNRCRRSGVEQDHHSTQKRNQRTRTPAERIGEDSGQAEEKLDEEHYRYKLLAEDERYYRLSYGDANRMIEKQTEQLTLLDNHVLQLKTYNTELEDQKKKFVHQLKNSADQLLSTKESWKKEANNNKELSKTILKKDDEIQNLQKKMSRQEQQIETLNMKMRNLALDRDVLSTKLNEREAEILNLKEKVKFLEQYQMVLDTKLAERVEDIRLLKVHLSEMDRCRRMDEGKVENLHTTRQELIKVQNELVEQRIVSKRVEGEIQRPINFHRWRILEGTDPDRAQLLAKTHTLQKVLIQKSNELDAKEVELRSMEKLVQKLREMVNRRSGEGVEDQLMDCRRELKIKVEKNKCLYAQVVMYEDLVGKYRKQADEQKQQLYKYKLSELEARKKKKTHPERE
ncbi:cilia- and flagella-associated protein 58 [Caerostris darwini]|uniref:Cilia- and flagella-associated protein 58 n=1 Tax=Caerostris darwini TaxID=1538125 RepID=A0AAV4N731_9ARAC|nr:cilia- and flagella-associated protein 58 [Caerostris darwini]